MPRLPRLRRAPIAVAAFLLAALLIAGPVQAHGLVGRRDLPVPSWLFAWAASAVLVASFVGLGALWREARLARLKERRLVRVPAWLEIPLGLLGIATLGLTIAAGLTGVQIDTANFAPTTIFVTLWLGIPFLSLLVGDLYAAVNPLRALGRATGWVACKVGGDRLPEPLAWSPKVGRWPAALGLLAFAWVELCFPGRGDPSQLAVLVLLFCVVQGIGMSLYGTDTWIRHADPFAVWFGWVASLAPLRWERGTVYLRPPGTGAAKIRPVVGDAAVVIIAIGTTTWDGLSGGSLLGTTIADLSNDIAGSSGSQTWANALVNTVGMLVVIGLVTALIFAGARGMISHRTRSAAARPPARDAPAVRRPCANSSASSRPRSCPSASRTPSATTSRCSRSKGRRSRRCSPTRSETFQRGRPGGSAPPTGRSTTRGSRPTPSGTCRSPRSSPAT